MIGESDVWPRYWLYVLTLLGLKVFYNFSDNIGISDLMLAYLFLFFWFEFKLKDQFVRYLILNHFFNIRRSKMIDKLIMSTISFSSFKIVFELKVDKTLCNNIRGWRWRG